VLPVLLVVICTAPGCGPDRSQQAPPNVILIVMDTVRADHLTLHGYERRTSPNIDAFAATATVYERAKSASNWSIPSHASIFTGKDPFEHGAHRMKHRRAVVKNPLHFRHRTLAEIFAGEGYITGAIVANDGYLSPKWQLDRGFQTYDAELAYANVINDRIYEWLETVEGKPFFLFVNYMDAHQPYNTTPRLNLLPEPVDRNKGLPVSLMRRVQGHQVPLPADMVERMIGQYDTGIANLDEEIGRLLARLKKDGSYDNTIIVLTSDHGESFGEHDHFVLHGNDVYETEVWVPLIIKGPGQHAPERVGHTASTSDIPRLVLQQLPDAMAVKYEAQFPNAPGNHPVISESYYSLKQLQVSRKYDRVRTAIYDWPYKYIRSSDGESELYKLDSDPGETRNVIGDHPDIVATLAKQLDDYMTARGRAKAVAEEPALTPEELKKLKALGYIGKDDTGD
jgi:arylsulfatase A-like enzyme